MWLWTILDYGNCKCIKRLVDKLVEECSEYIDENKLISVTSNHYKNMWFLYNIHGIMGDIFILNIGISCAFFVKT